MTGSGCCHAQPDEGRARTVVPTPWRRSEVNCRCEVLNVMTGDAARDYARTHLDVVRSDGHGTTYYRCPQTGMTWAEEQAPAPYAGTVRRLRRAERV